MEIGTSSSNRLRDLARPDPDALDARVLCSFVAERLFGEEAETHRVEIGGFQLVQPLGEGAIGQVFEAWDPELQRRIAIKLLKDERDGAAGDLLEEAQALANFSHPNVIHVYAVGRHEGSVFMAMELVDGDSLRRWGISEPRPRVELLEAYGQAGLGLLAAHQAGLVHRDFKPDNAVMGADGRVRVVDFGLARRMAATTEPEALGTSSTRPGALRPIEGTLPYMAPEVRLGEPANELSDQFSFCVALYEALVGHRPVTPWSRRGREQVERDLKGLPQWLRKALLRGLSLEPTNRWPSMSDLLEAIDHRTAARRRRTKMAAGVMTGVLAIGSGTVYQLVQEELPMLCTREDGWPAAIWSEERRGELEAAIASTGAPSSAGAWARTSRYIDEYVGGWERASSDACDRFERGEGNRDIAACLERSAQHFTQLVDALGAVDAKGLINLDEVLDTLVSGEVCQSSGGRGECIPQTQDEVVDALVSDAQVLLALGNPEGALERMGTAESSTNDLRRRAHVLLLEGLALRALDRYADAEAKLSLAMGLAYGQGCHDISASATRTLVEIAMEDLQDHRVTGVLIRLHEGMAWAYGARAEAAQFELRGLVAEHEGRYEEAVEHYSGVVELYEEHMGETHGDTMRAQVRLANALGELGELDALARSSVIYRWIIAKRNERFGENNPKNARLHVYLGMNERLAGTFDVAIEELTHAYALRRANEREPSIDTATIEVMLAQTLLEQLVHTDAPPEEWPTKHADNLAKAQALASHALSILSRELPLGHTDRLAAWEAFTNVERIRGNHETCIAAYLDMIPEYRIAVDEGRIAPTDPRVVMIPHNIAWELCEVGRCDEAYEWLEEARRGPHEPRHAYYFDVTEARARIQGGECAKAQELLTQVAHRVSKDDAALKDLALMADIEKYGNQAETCPAGSAP